MGNWATTYVPLRLARQIRAWRRPGAWLGVAFIAPSLAVLFSVVLYPLVYALALAFFMKNLLKPQLGTPFVGLENFAWLTNYELFWDALRISLTLTASVVIGSLVAGMGIALLLNGPIRGRGLLRGLFMLPWAVPTVVAAITWSWMLDTQYGPVNHVLRLVGLIQTDISWLGQPLNALGVLIVAHIWKELPWITLVLLAGLQQIPEDIREAARIDGASSWQEFWNVTIPGLRYVITIVIILETIWTFNWFDYTWLLTRGGPNDSTMTLPILVYRLAFETYNLGRASAVALVMFGVLASLMFLFLRMNREAEA